MKQIGVFVFVLAAIGITIAVSVYFFMGVANPNGDGKVTASGEKESSSKPETVRTPYQGEPRVFPRGEKLFFWWDQMPVSVTRTSYPTGPESNIHPGDYVGADTCKKCHEQNFLQWEKHPHHWMNAQATPQTVLGSFTDKDEIKYLGGRATFSRDGEVHRMILNRDQTELVYEIDQTIGSRFFQYYIGRLIDGPFPEEHPYRTTRHVLPFGYWLQKKMWVPVVHVGPELPDGQRTDPFNMPEVPETGKSFLPYAKFCNMCHSTFPMGDNLFRKPFVLEKHFPGYMHVDMAGYLESHRKELWPEGATRENATQDDIFGIPPKMTMFDAETHGVSFGISCEACHFGCKQHVEDPKQLPSFAPKSEFVRMQTGDSKLNTGRTHENLNWACGRCHTGTRPLYAGGMSTWNSTEYTDAMKGSCYSKLTCVECHQPHEATGPKWSHTPAEDDAKCIKCHQNYSSKEQITAHTHHAPGSTGSNCMNCHMPKLNEGLQEVVRTHTIFSPNNMEMMERNQPNACNMCHTDKTIDWTVKYMKEWYSSEFDPKRIARNYDKSQPVGIGWLKSENEAVRLIAIDSMGRNADRWAGVALLDSLNDPFLINRQFAMDVVEKVFEVKLDEFGYKFYMTPEERRVPIERLKKHIESQKSALPKPKP